MAAFSQTQRVQGLRELNRAFELADKKLVKDFRGRLKEEAEPVRSDAEALALSGIRRMTPEWGAMRVGVTRTSVYVAPKARGARGRGPKSRPNLARLLLGESMLPALDRNVDGVVRGVNAFLGEIERGWGMGG